MSAGALGAELLAEVKEERLDEVCDFSIYLSCLNVAQ